MSNSTDSALVRPFRTIYALIGGVFDAVYYFIATLIPGNSGRLNGTHSSRSGGSGYGSGYGSGSGSGPRIGTIHRFRGSAPNMAVGGCRSCM